MNNSEKEKISALIDNALSEHELDGTIKTASKLSDCAETASRYQLIGNALRAESIDLDMQDLASAVHDRLQYEPTVLAPKKKSKIPKWVQPAVGGAIAASVGLLAINLLVVDNNANVGEPFTGSPVASVERMQPVMPVNNKSETWRKIDPELQAKLDQYLVDHNEFSTPAATGGLMPYSTLVSYDRKR